MTPRAFVESLRRPILWPVDDNVPKVLGAKKSIVAHAARVKETRLAEIDGWLWCEDNAVWGAGGRAFIETARRQIEADVFDHWLDNLPRPQTRKP